MNWLICGSGFLGTEFSKRLSNLNLDNDIHSKLRYAHLISAFEKNRIVEELTKLEPEVFVNVAGPSNVSESFSLRELYENSPELLCQAHLEILGRIPKPPIYVFISSAAVYGDTSEAGASEMHPLKPITPYGIGKIKAENYLLQAGIREGVPVTILRVFSSYSNNLKTRLPFVIFSKFRAQTDREFAGYGDESRDFIHTGDIVRAMKIAVGNLDSEMPPIWNVGTGFKCTVDEIIKIAVDEFAKHDHSFFPNYSFSKSNRPWDPKYLTADISKLKLHDFVLKVEPRNGLREYFKSNLHAY